MSRFRNTCEREAVGWNAEPRHRAATNSVDGDRERQQPVERRMSSCAGTSPLEASWPRESAPAIGFDCSMHDREHHDAFTTRLTSGGTPSE